MRDGNLAYALLCLIARRQDGVHGYRLKRELEGLCEDEWSVDYQRVYRVLQSLEQCGDLTVCEEVQSRRPKKKLYRLTDKGTETVENWLNDPAQVDAFPLRDEIAFKLLFVDNHDISRIANLLNGQRSVCMTKLRRVARRQVILRNAGFDGLITKLMVEIAESRVRAELTWLERIERAIIKNELT